MTASSLPPVVGRRRRSDRSRSTTRIVAVAAKYASLIVFVLVVIVPIVVVLFASFKSDREYANSGALAPPTNWFDLGNFVVAWQKGGMARGFLNTALILVVSLVFTILIGTLAAYALDRFDFRGKRLVFGLFLVATLVPGVTTQVATFQVINALGLVDNYLSAILLYSGTDIVSVYIFIQFMQSIPKSLDEAAMLEGANRLTVYWRIILPLLQPAIATVIIIKGIAIYNDFYIPFLYLPSQDHGTISTSLFRFYGPESGHQNQFAAAVLIVIIPTVVVFIALQRFIYSGITQGAVK